MGEISTNNVPDTSTLALWTMLNLRTPPPPRIDVRITTFKTEDALEVLMVIKIDDDKN
jgi:hypothetical protein